jgi:hypothetical protein
MTDLQDRLEANTRAWRPDGDDPDVLVGKIVSVELGQTEYGPYPLVIVEDEASGEELAVHGFHTVLKNELIRQRPKAGERIGIKYLGDIATKAGSPYKSYKGWKVRVERETGTAFDWSQISGEPDPEPITTPQPHTPDPVPVPADAGDDGIPF